MNWKCPACFEVVNGDGQETLDWHVRAHIYIHEHRAGQLAVERARVNCIRTYCEIGTPPAGDRLLSYDEKFLQDVKVIMPKGNAGH